MGNRSHLVGLTLSCRVDGHDLCMWNSISFWIRGLCIMLDHSYPSVSFEQAFLFKDFFHRLEMVIAKPIFVCQPIFWALWPTPQVTSGRLVCLVISCTFGNMSFCENFSKWYHKLHTGQSPISAETFTDFRLRLFSIYWVKQLQNLIEVGNGIRLPAIVIFLKPGWT